MAYEPLTGDTVRSMKDEEISVLITQMREKLFTLRNQRVSEKVEDNSQFGKIRRDIARLMTERHARANA